MTTRITELEDRGGTPVRLLQVCRVEARPPRGAPIAVGITRTPFRIGSHHTNDLVIDDETVSKHHLEIEVGEHGWRISDLSSSNGTWLGSTAVSELTVTQAVELRLGQTHLSLVPTDERAEVPATREPRFGRMCGVSAVMRELFAQLERVAQSDCPVLIEGEPGTGKEVCAESLHAASARAGGPFVVVDCAALASDVAESELFGHERGAFTGADSSRVGLIGMADGGTLFLDGISELPARLQARLVGLLDRGALLRVGASKPASVDVRVVAASAVDLAREANEGRFRADLFHRLAIARVRLPPLRERLDDLPLLAREALADVRARSQRTDIPEELSAVALARLRARAWGGNVRELWNAVERAVLGGVQGERAAAAVERPLPYRQARDAFIAQFTIDAFAIALKQADGNLARAARTIGVDARNFRRLLASYGTPIGALRER